jgi:uncharacterized protein (TIGR00290 family)
VVIVARTAAGTAHMDSKKKVTISWSGGKDSALALHRILRSGEFEICHLHTVIDAGTKRVGLHGVREALIEKQAKALGLKLVKLYLPASNDHHTYEQLMCAFYNQCFNEGIQGVVFGDIFLEDLKNFRERMLRAASLDGIFPLWKEDSRMLINEFISLRFKTMICSANAAFFQSSEVGKIIDLAFINDLPLLVDPCGENGEFHTFVFDGPVFAKPVLLKKGEVVKKDYHYRITLPDGTVQDTDSSFWFQELSPIDSRGDEDNYIEPFFTAS